MAEPIKLDDLLDLELLSHHETEGLVKRQHHPDLPLAILNYTQRCQFARTWDQVTTQCRGLIVDTGTGEVVARPFPKFFNHGEPDAPTVPLDAPVIVTDKADGSLGIVYPTPEGHAVATRGSFTSDQALHATQVWRHAYERDVWELRGWTKLVEIVYPSNRNVVDYGDLDDLILLGLSNVADGMFIQPRTAAAVLGWHGPVVATFEHETLADALASPPRPNAEGLVVMHRDAQVRVKVKQDDYVALHRIVTGLNARTVWRHMVDGGDLDALIEPLPDEFHGWVRDVWNDIRADVDQRCIDAEDAYRELVGRLPDGWSRKDFAIEAVKHPEKAALFALLDGRDIRPAFLRDAKPAADWTPSGRAYSEDVA